MKRNILKHHFTFGIELVLIPLILGVIALPQARKNARTSSCVNNLKHLSMAALMYAQDNVDWYPEDKNLTDCLPMLATYIGDNEKVFICPMTKSQTPTYAFLLSNTGLKISQIKKPSSLPVFICDAHAKYQEVVVAFADGHVESINGYKLIDGGVSGNGYKFSAFWMKGNRFGQHTN